MKIIQQFNYQEYLRKITMPSIKKDGTSNPPQKHIVIIALFIAYAGMKPENKEQISSIIKRNLRSAQLLVGYRYERIKEVMKWLRENADYKWGLETVGKFIDYDLSKLIKKNTSFGDNFPKI